MPKSSNMPGKTVSGVAIAIFFEKKKKIGKKGKKIHAEGKSPVARN